MWLSSGMLFKCLETALAADISFYHESQFLNACFRLIETVTAFDFTEMAWNTYVVENKRFATYEGQRPDDSWAKGAVASREFNGSTWSMDKERLIEHKLP
jgi:hypothetical protein